MGIGFHARTNDYEFTEGQLSKTPTETSVKNVATGIPTTLWFS